MMDEKDARKLMMEIEEMLPKDSWNVVDQKTHGMAMGVYLVIEHDSFEEYQEHINGEVYEPSRWLMFKRGLEWIGMALNPFTSTKEGDK